MPELPELVAPLEAAFEPEDVWAGCVAAGAVVVGVIWGVAAGTVSVGPKLAVVCVVG